jgi:hypothetical protein
MKASLNQGFVAMAQMTGPGREMPAASRSPSWRQLAGLAAVVAAAHLLVLRSPQLRLAPPTGHEANRAVAFETRTIEAEPAPVAIAAPPRPPRPPRAARAPRLRAAAPRPVRKPEAKLPEAQAPSESPAIDPGAPASATAENGSPAGDAGSDVVTEIPPVPSLQETGTSPAPPSAGAAAPDGPKTTPVGAVTLPPSVLLHYKMIGKSKGLNYQANAELGWNNGGDHYDAYMKVGALFLGSRSMTSTGQITSAGLAPMRFADKFKSEQAAHFETDKGKISFSGNTPDAPWIEGAQDRVSVFLQLGGALAARPGDFPPGSEITLYTVGPRAADSWTFTVEAAEQLEVLGSAMPAIKVTRKPRSEYDQKVEIWYAPSLDYLPVRNRITQQNGDFIDQQLSSLTRP